MRKNPDQVGFAVNPRRWVVERFFAWIGRNRRLAKDFEATNQLRTRLPLRRIRHAARASDRSCFMTFETDSKTEVFDRSRRDRKRVEILFAHLKRIFRLGRLRLRGPCGAQFEFTLAATAQNLRRLAKLVVRPPPVTEARFAFFGEFCAEAFLDSTAP